jgi:hypothetical protein
MGSLPCDIDYLDQYAVVAALDGPDKSKGAPVYLLENDRLVSVLVRALDLVSLVVGDREMRHRGPPIRCAMPAA